VDTHAETQNILGKTLTKLHSLVGISVSLHLEVFQGLSVKPVAMHRNEISNLLVTCASFSKYKSEKDKETSDNITISTTVKNV